MSRKYFFESICGDNVILSSSDCRQLEKVLRVRVGEHITVSSGTGDDFLCEVTATSPLKIQVIQSLPVKHTMRKLTVFAAVSKGDKLSLVVQKCTELGAYSIVIFGAQHSDFEIKNQKEKNERYSKIAKEAAKQCGSSILPSVKFCTCTEDALQMAKECETLLICHEKADTRLQQIKLSGSVAVFTGPEGGFSEQEIILAKKAGAIPILISNNILRCETAPIAAAAIIMAME